MNAGTFCAFTYLAPLVTDVAGLAEAWVPGVLALFGLGAFAGVTAAGRLHVPLPLAAATLAAGWALLAPSAASPAALLALVPLLGALSFGVGSTLIIRALHEASDAPRLAGAFATSALNVGAALGPVLGGLAIDHGFGYRAPAVISALLTASALAVLITFRPGGRSLSDEPAQLPL